MKQIITLKIDGNEVKAEEEMTILEAAKRLDIEIPTLCYHEGLELYGACRICSVEIEKRGRTRIVAACCYPVEEGLTVITKSSKLDKIRKTLIELAAVSSGEDSGKLRALAIEYNADLTRFSSRVQMEPTKCVLCGLCIRRCVEANWDSVIGFVGRGTSRRVAIYPERKEVCAKCNYCYVVCPTGRITSTGVDPPFPSIDDILAGRE
jgi:NADH dehydrogenase/NADH:ubiquinone oxidoreductase subunit G